MLTHNPLQSTSLLQLCTFASASAVAKTYLKDWARWDSVRPSLLPQPSVYNTCLFSNDVMLVSTHNFHPLPNVLLTAVDVPPLHGLSWINSQLLLNRVCHVNISRHIGLLPTLAATCAFLSEISSNADKIWYSQVKIRQAGKTVSCQSLIIALQKH